MLSTLCIPTWAMQKSMQHTLRSIMMYPNWRFHNTWIFVHTFLSEHLLCKILNLSPGERGPIFNSFLLWNDHNEWTEEMKPHFARKCLTRKWGIKRGGNEPSPMTGLLFENAIADWSWHKHKKMPVVDRLSPSLQTHAFIDKIMNHFIILFYLHFEA